MRRSNEMSSPSPLSPSPFMSLPTELHAHIASYLSYPDALALKHTNAYFYALVPTGLALKVNWILERCRLKLRVPFKTCEFRTDKTFCNREIREIMEIRRRHQECKPGAGGCLVVEGLSCGGRTPFWLLRRSRLILWKRKTIVTDYYGEDFCPVRQALPVGCWLMQLLSRIFTDFDTALILGIAVCFIGIICVPASRALGYYPPSIYDG
ncbi:hypothetical protein AJ79_05739 [Helicocarpus griseus UAMH5409]|uniref:F-box domain-containing protein n=1 Tax=Helicocarpus griseus UAMH5409 TaxID=1447875 RepID=A0A2B7XJX0_9EURO|nr:hypothetical protein AJ79_05739 [Helicocarpus griseus UAMH5409]